MLNRLVALGVAMGGTMGLLATVWAAHAVAQPVTHGVHCVELGYDGAAVYDGCTAVYGDVQAAVDAAASGDEVWVATGTYTGVHAREAVSQVLFIAKSVAVRGGYVAPFTAAPDPVANPTVLNAQGDGRVIYINGRAREISVTFDGLQITGGNADGLGGVNLHSDDAGGGILAIEAAVVISNSVIDHNLASQSSGMGGGLAAFDSQVTLVDSRVADNLANTVFDRQDTSSIGGGGLALLNSGITLLRNEIISNTAVVTYQPGSRSTFILGGGVYFSNVHGEFRHNHVMSNTTVQHYINAQGGGVAVEGSVFPSLIIDDNYFYGNIANRGTMTNSTFNAGGGFAMWLSGAGTVTFTNNIVESNASAMYAQLGDYGGGFINGSGSTQLVFNHNLIADNTTTRGSGLLTIVGGVAIYDVQLEMIDNEFRNNRNRQDGLSFIGGLFVSGSTGYIDRLVAVGNETWSFGALAVENGTLTMTNIAVVDNLVDAGVHIGGEMSLEGAHWTVTNNGERGILISNETSMGSRPDAAEVSLKNFVFVSHTVGISMLQAAELSLEGVLWHGITETVSAVPGASVVVTHELFADPLFLADGYHIFPNSPAINQGVRTAAAIPFDIDGQARLGAPDLGVDELIPYSLFAPAVYKPDPVH